MNEPRFEVLPRSRPMAHPTIPYAREKIGGFAWHFKDANGHITFTGGESFTRREDAHRSIGAVVADVVGFVLHPQVRDSVAAVISYDTPLPIIDLDENGDMIEAEGKP